MRRFLTVLLAVVGVFGSLAIPAIAAQHRKSRCSVRRGWRVVVQDRQAVVIRQRHKQFPTYDYCSRAVRAGWHGLAPGAGFEPASPLLTGRYIAFATVREPPQDSDIELLDTRSGQRNALTVGGFAASFSLPTLVLSPNGVAAAVVVISPYSVMGGQYIAQPLSASIQVLTLHAQDQNLDDASPPSEIANLQLYDCAAGCATNTTTVAWTNGGVQHYAQITP